MKLNVMNSGQNNFKLTQLKVDPPFHAGQIGLLAIYDLLASTGRAPSALREMCVAAGSMDDAAAFESVFGTSLAAFEESFEVQ